MVSESYGLQYLIVYQCIVAEANAQAFFIDGSALSNIQVTYLTYKGPVLPCIAPSQPQLWATTDPVMVLLLSSLQLLLSCLQKY